MIPLSRPKITESQIEAINAVLRSGMLVQGPQVEEFEAELAEVVGAKHVVVVNSGTAALFASLKALAVGPGDIVLVAAYSWIATANVVPMCGAEVRFIDIEERTLGMDPAALTRDLHSLGEQGELHRVKALIPVHVFGTMCEIPAILRIATEYDIPVVEDAACALGARLEGTAAGGFGRLGCFSFHPRKVITTGEGGAVVTDEPGLAAHIRAFRNHGQVASPTGREFVMVGDNLRMTDFQAALGRAQLSELPNLLADRRRLADNYSTLLAGLPVELLTPGEEHSTVQTYAVRLADQIDLDSVVSRLRTRGIETAGGTIVMPETTAYSQFTGSCPKASRLASSVLSLPLSQGMSPDQQVEVIDALGEALEVRS